MIDKILEGIEKAITEDITWNFMLITIATTYVLLKFIFKGKSETFRIYLNLGVCMLWLIAFAAFWGYDVPELLVTSMCSVAVYQWVIKFFIDKFNVAYPKNA